MSSLCSCSTLQDPIPWNGLLNLLLLDPEELHQGRLVLRGRRARHLMEILHVKPGDKIRAGLLNGPLGHAEVEEILEEELGLRCSFDDKPLLHPKVDLILALPRPKVLRRMWAPLASLQVGHIALTNAWRVERNYFDTHLLKPEVYKPLLMQGLEQAQCTFMPTVSVHKRLVDLVDRKLDEVFGTKSDPRLLAHPGAEDSISGILMARPTKRVLLAVGPEGGWIDRELELFDRAGFLSVNVGRSILRTDVACHVLLGLINELRP